MKPRWQRYIKKLSLMLLICFVAVAAVDAQVGIEEITLAQEPPPTQSGRAPGAPAASPVSAVAVSAEVIAAPADGEVESAAIGDSADVAPPAVAQDTAAQAAPEVVADDDLEDEEEPGQETVRLSVKDADLSAILKLLAEQHKLNIIAGKDVSGRVTADFYGITVDEALKAILEMNGYAYVRENNFVKVYTREQLQAMERAQAKVVTRVFRLNYVNVDEAKELIRPALSKTAQVSASSRAIEGIPSGGSNVGGDSYSLTDKIVIRDYEENILECERLLKEIDIRPLQVMVEATILAVTLNDETSVGVDFNVLAGVDFRGLSTAAFNVANPNAAIAAGATAAVDAIPFGRVGTSGFAPPGPGLNVGVITNDVSLFIRALESVEDVNVLSNPKIMALNKQRAEVLVGNRLGYRTTMLTQTTAVETVEFLDTGTQLRFRPFISNDGFIRMEIHPEVSTGTISATDLPSQQTTEVTCNIIVRDGHTIVIGGLFEETTSINKSQVPLLGSIPVLGALFRNETDRTVRREIVVLLTPHILNHDQANADGRAILESIERQVTGLRSAFPFYTREKLTQIHLMEADKYCTRYLQSGCPDERAMAVWNLKLARNVAPNNLEVIKRLELMEAETALQRPRLQNESILWRRMSSSGMLNQLPALPDHDPSVAEEVGAEAVSQVTPELAVEVELVAAELDIAPEVAIDRAELTFAVEVAVETYEMAIAAVDVAVEIEETVIEVAEVAVETNEMATEAVEVAVAVVEPGETLVKEPVSSGERMRVSEHRGQRVRNIAQSTERVNQQVSAREACSGSIGGTLLDVEVAQSPRVACRAAGGGSSSITSTDPSTAAFAASRAGQGVDDGIRLAWFAYDRGAGGSERGAVPRSAGGGKLLLMWQGMQA